MNGLALKPHLFRLYLEIYAGKVELKFYNSAKKLYDEILWNSFFFEYDKENYLRAFKYISKKVYHPVTFCGKVKSVEPSKENF